MVTTSILHNRRRRKLLWLFPLLLLLYMLLFHCPYRYDGNKAVAYIQNHYNSTSKCMCAWYVMSALRSGGCVNCYLYPAYAYNKILPQLGFTEVSRDDYIPVRGDISVLPRNHKSSFGHIAIYDGQFWISDFKQESIYPGKTYRELGEYQIYRIKDGWHWSQLELNIQDIPDYLKSLLKEYKRIRL